MAETSSDLFSWLTAAASGASVVISGGAAALSWFAFRRNRRHLRITRVTVPVSGKDADRLVIEWHNDGAWDEFVTHIGVASGIWLWKREDFRWRSDGTVQRNGFGDASIPRELLQERWPTGVKPRGRVYVRTAAGGTYTQAVAPEVLDSAFDARWRLMSGE